MIILLKGSVFCVLVWCVVAQSELNDASNLQHVVSEILRRLDEKDTQIDKLQQRLDNQEKLNAEQNNRLTDQDAVIETLKQRLLTLEAESITPAETIETVNNSMSSDESANGSTQEENGGVQKGQQRIRQAMADRPVAFFATQTMDLYSVNLGQPLVFERVITNVGNAYNPHVGVFTAPVSGIYVFSVSLYASGFAKQYILKKNYEAISGIDIHYTDDTGMATSKMSLTVVLQLAKGDEVTVSNNMQHQLFHSDFFNTFGGFLVWEDLSHQPVQPVIVGK